MKCMDFRSRMIEIHKAGNLKVEVKRIWSYAQTEIPTYE